MRISERARSRSTAVFLAGEQFYRPNWSVYRYDPARARRLLEQAGCRRGADGIYSCAGERCGCASSPPPERPAANWRCSSCGRSYDRQASRSTRSTLRPAPSSARSCPGGNFDAALFGWGVSGRRPHAGDEVRGPQNWAGYCSRLAMRDVQQADRILAPALRARALERRRPEGRARRARAAALPGRSSAWRSRTRSAASFAGGTDFNFLENTEDWWVERATEVARARPAYSSACGRFPAWAW